MKAIRIHNYGGPETLCWEDAPRPSPGPGEVLVRVHAAGVNPADYKHRNGMFRDFVTETFPKILGYDVAGTVEALGPDTEGPAPGTRVFAMLDPMDPGGYAQFVSTAVQTCGIMPDGMDFETAAGIPCSALTGTQLVEDALRPRPGETVLITGATGMVGRFAVIAAKRAGARVVAAVRPAYAEAARRLGADEAVALDGSNWSGAPFDGVIDTVGGPAASPLAASVKPGGRILTVATTPLDPVVLPVEPEFFSVHPDGARLTSLGEAVMRGETEVPVVARFPLAEAAQAHAAIEQGGLLGKIVLTVDEP